MAAAPTRLGHIYVVISGDISVGDHARHPRHSLTDQRILAEALALVDEAGLDALTTRALGQRLGVDPTAVYRHFRNKDELLGALADRILASSDSDQATSSHGDGDGS